MKAAIIHAPRDVTLEDVEKPIIKNDEVLVKVKACGICGTDLHAYRTGILPSRILGHEFSGDVVEIGADVKGLEMGDRVLGTGYQIDSNGVAVPGEGLDGAMAEYVVVPNPLVGDSFLHVPDNMSYEEAATVEPTSIACYAFEQANLNPDDIVVILGSGMIGLGLVQVCKAHGIPRVIVSEPSKGRREMAAKVGADVVINPSEVDALSAVIEATGGWKANVVFECSGSPASFTQAPRMLKFLGKVMQVGFFEQGIEMSRELISEVVVWNNLTIRGCGGQKWDMATELIHQGKIKTKDMITCRFPLDKVKEAFETQLQSNDVIKVMLNIDSK